MADIQLKFSPAQGVTFTASSAITGGQLVEVTGNRRVAPAGASSLKAVGVAMRDAVAEANVLVETIGSGPVVALTATGAIAAGDRVASAAAGTVSTVAGAGATYVQAEANATRAIVGLALEAIANGQKGLVHLRSA